MANTCSSSVARRWFNREAPVRATSRPAPYDVPAAMLAWLVLALAFVGFSPGGAADAHVLAVPYRNQLDGTPYALANCGPTSLSMVLAYYGIDASPWELRVRSMQAQHSWVDDPDGYSDRYGVWVYNLATAAETFGLHADGLWARDAARSDHLHE